MAVKPRAPDLARLTYYYFFLPDFFFFLAGAASSLPASAFLAGVSFFLQNGVVTLAKPFLFRKADTNNAHEDTSDKMSGTAGRSFF